MMVLSTAITITVSDHLKILRIFFLKTDEKTEAQKISKVKSLH